MVQYKGDIVAAAVVVAVISQRVLANRSFQVNGIPSAKPRCYQRTRFVVENIANVAFKRIVVDVVVAWARGYYTTLEERPVQPTIHDSTLIWRLVYASAIALNLRTSINVFCLVLAAITVERV